MKSIYYFAYRPCNYFLNLKTFPVFYLLVPISYYICTKTVTGPRHAIHPILFINFSNMYKRYHAILMAVVKQYLLSYWAAIVWLFKSEYWRWLSDKWANIFKIAWKLPWLKWNDLCILIIEVSINYWSPNVSLENQNQTYMRYQDTPDCM